MLRKNFEAATNLAPLKKHAIQLCGQEFIQELSQKGLYAKDDDFWQAVNDKLDISPNAYDTRQKQEWEERQRQESERVERETNEINRLLDNKKHVRKNTRHNWEIIVYKLPNSALLGQKFIATAKKEFDEIGNTNRVEEATGFCDTPDRAYSMACGLADSRDIEEQREIEFQRRYRVLKPLYLVAIYLFSWDDFRGCDYKARPPRDPEARRQFYLEYFNGVGSYSGFDFDILNRLEKEGMMKFSNSNKTLSIDKEAVRQAIDAAKQMNIPGMEELLDDKAIHLECLDYKNHQQRIWEQSKEY
jgi:hypothetical protein